MVDSYTKTISERDKSQEAKYKMDEEARFKAEARRNKLLGLWAGERMGMTPSQCEDYAKEVVIADLEEAGSQDVIRKVSKDFQEHKVKITDEGIQNELERLYPIALEQICESFPEALGKDHEKVGD